MLMSSIGTGQRVDQPPLLDATAVSTADQSHPDAFVLTLVEDDDELEEELDLVAAKN